MNGLGRIDKIMDKAAAVWLADQTLPTGCDAPCAKENPGRMAMRVWDRLQQRFLLAVLLFECSVYLAVSTASLLRTCPYLVTVPLSNAIYVGEGRWDSDRMHELVRSDRALVGLNFPLYVFLVSCGSWWNAL